MPQDFFDELKDGDQVQPAHLNRVHEELSRLRLLKGAGSVAVNGMRHGRPVVESLRPQRAHIQLTGSYASGYPWKEVVITPGGTAQDTGVTGGPTTGNAAFERRTGDTSLTAGDTVYHAWQSPASGEWLFPHRHTTPPCDGTATFKVYASNYPVTSCPLVGVKITVKDPGGSVIFTGFTDSFGTVTGPHITTPGTYTYTYELADWSFDPGFGGSRVSVGTGSYNGCSSPVISLWMVPDYLTVATDYGSVNMLWIAAYGVYGAYETVTVDNLVELGADCTCDAGTPGGSGTTTFFWWGSYGPTTGSGLNVAYGVCHCGTDFPPEWHYRKTVAAPLTGTLFNFDPDDGCDSSVSTENYNSTSGSGSNGAGCFSWNPTLDTIDSPPLLTPAFGTITVSTPTP
jgi:hypothetical protein